ncbi:MAG: mucoidy inhibitor MuiA family protein [Chloroflexi bacterium]|nr:mucoidy inhibitor MuiA family protein [Chloroflexota bacterium]
MTSTADTCIAQVTVFPDRAQVTRRGTVSLGSGHHRLEVTDLPSSIDVDSVRVAAEGTARALLIGLDVRREHYVDTPADRVRELEREIEGLEREQEGADHRIATLEEERTAVGSLGRHTEVYARGLAYGRSTADAQMHLFDLLRERLDAINTTVVELAAARRSRERKIDKLRRELQELQGAGGRERRTVIIECEVQAAGDLVLELSYVIRGAGWQPLYDFRLNEANGAPELVIMYHAAVCQRTGEDWEGVALTLSTARPALAQAVPELAPWIVGPAVPMPSSEPVLVRASARSAMDDGDAVLSVAPFEGVPAVPAVEEARTLTAQVADSGSAVSYIIPGEVSVAADGAQHRVTVAKFALAPRLDYVAAPKRVGAVFRWARVPNDSPYTLLPGPAAVFVGTEYLGKSAVDLTPPQGEIDLVLGSDDRFEIKREMVRREIDKRLIGDRRRQRQGYAITVENHLSVVSTLILRDQIPLSGHEEVKVRLEMSQPEPSSATETGQLEWILQLQPGQRQVVRFDFAVECPREMVLVGMP